MSTLYYSSLGSDLRQVVLASDSLKIIFKHQRVLVQSRVRRKLVVVSLAYSLASLLKELIQ